MNFPVLAASGAFSKLFFDEIFCAFSNSIRKLFIFLRGDGKYHSAFPKYNGESLLTCFYKMPERIFNVFSVFLLFI